MTAAQRQLHAQAGSLLRAAFGEAVRDAPGEPAYFVAVGRVGVRVNVEAVGDADAVRELYAWIAQGLAVTPEVGLYLAERNIAMRFGSLAVDGERAIIFQHSLFAEAVGAVVLGRLVGVLASSADALDQELRERFSGPRAVRPRAPACDRGSCRRRRRRRPRRASRARAGRPPASPGAGGLSAAAR
jgi:hypothetical protein